MNIVTAAPPLPYAASLPTRPLHLRAVPAARMAIVPATVERELLWLLPPVPLAPLPKRLNPRRQPPAHRFVWFLGAAVVGAAITGLWLLQARYGLDTTAVSR